MGQILGKEENPWELTEYDEECPLKIDPFPCNQDQDEGQDVEYDYALQERLGPVDLIKGIS